MTAAHNYMSVGEKTRLAECREVDSISIGSMNVFDRKSADQPMEGGR